MPVFPSERIYRRVLVVAAAVAVAACGGGSDDNAANPPVMSQSSLAGTTQLANTSAATLNNAQETSATASTARGSGSVTIDPATRQLVATVTINGTVATSVQVEAGPPGTSGPVVFALTETGSPGSGVWSAALTLTQAQLDALQAGNWYFNVRSAAFPNGEIRGQIVLQVKNNSTGTSSSASISVSGAGTSAAGVFVAALRGSQETPPTSSGAKGAGAVQVNTDTRLMVAAVATTGINGTTARIQAAAPGAEGAEVFPLTQAIPGSGVWSTTVTLTDIQYRALQTGNWYFNISSAAFPAGEIRGQILPLLQVAAPTNGVIGTTGSGTGAFGAGTLNGSAGTGTGGLNTGITGTGIGSNIGSGSSIGSGIGSNIGTTGTGISSIGTTGFGSTGTGTTGIGTTGFGNTGTGTTGIGTTGFGNTGTGTTGIGTTGFGSTGTGTTGIGTSSTSSSTSGTGSMF